MILLALLVPLAMMAFLFAADALEDLIFPPAAPQDEDPQPADIAGTTTP